MEEAAKAAEDAARAMAEQTAAAGTHFTSEQIAALERSLETAIGPLCASPAPWHKSQFADMFWLGFVCSRTGFIGLHLAILCMGPEPSNFGNGSHWKQIYWEREPILIFVSLLWVVQRF